LDATQCAERLGNKMKSESHQATRESSLTRALRKKMNLALIRVAQLEVTDKRAEEISLGDVVGNLDALGFLILFVSLVVTLICGTLSGMLFLMVWPQASILVYLGAIPGVIVGFFICYFLFRIKRWLRS
jgi:hypothetical protein